MISSGNTREELASLDLAVSAATLPTLNMAFWLMDKLPAIGNTEVVGDNRIRVSRVLVPILPSLMPQTSVVAHQRAAVSILASFAPSHGLCLVSRRNERYLYSSRGEVRRIRSTSSIMSTRSPPQRRDTPFDLVS